MPSSVFATISRFTFSDLVFLSLSILFGDVSFFSCEVLMELYGSGAPSSHALAAFLRSGSLLILC